MAKIGQYQMIVIHNPGSLSGGVFYDAQVEVSS